MSGARIPAGLHATVAQRAGGHCEYCQVSDGAVMWPHEADHIIAEQHGGKTELENLALACFNCNRHKGPNVAGIDSETGQVVRLFNPRIDHWAEHFRVEGPRIMPLSGIGRATAELLCFNAPGRLLVRQALWQSGQL